MKRVDTLTSAPTSDSVRARIRRRAILGASTISTYYASALYVFKRWIADATMNARQPQPIGLTIGMCLLAIAFFALIQQHSRVNIIVIGLLGLLLGLFLFPSTSAIPEHRLRLILSGDYVHFAPFSFFCGACAGTLIGQNMTVMRAWLERLNRGRLTL